MLVPLTSAALQRGWNPQLFLRLFLQLQDSAESLTARAALDTFVKLVERDHNPLLFEYVLCVLCEAKSVVHVSDFVEWLATTDWRARSENVDNFIAYIARSPDVELTAADRKLLASQAEEGSKHVSLLLQGGASQPSSTPNPKDAASAGPDPVSRLIWLEWMLRTGQDMNDVPYFVSVLWPEDRGSVIGYELVLTAFEVFTLDSSNTDKRCEFFITSKLPLILHSMKLAETDVVIARVFATMDKTIASRVEQRSPDIRRKFGVACVTLGLCREDVLSVLQAEINGEIENRDDELAVNASDILSNPQTYTPSIPNMSLLNIAQVSQDLVRACHGALETPQPVTTQTVAAVCAALVAHPEIADLVFVHASPYSFCVALCTQADALSLFSNTEAAVPVYALLGTLLNTLDFLSTRYRITLPPSWARIYLERGFWGSDANKLDSNLSADVSKWIMALFSNNGTGISTALLRPFRELADVLPVVVRQAVWAYRSAVIDRETLRMGVDHFLYPLPGSLFAPLVLKVLQADFFEGRHPSATIECALLFLTKYAHMSSSNTDQFSVGESAHSLATATKSAELRNMANLFKAPAAEELLPVANTSLLERLFSSMKVLARWNVWPHGVPPQLSNLLQQALGIIKFNKLLEITPQNLKTACFIAIALYKVDPHLLLSELASKMPTDAELARTLLRLQRERQAGLETLYQSEQTHKVELDASSLQISKSAAKPPAESEVANTSDAISVDQSSSVQLPTEDTFDKVDLYDEFVNQPMDLEDLDMAMADEWR